MSATKIYHELEVIEKIQETKDACSLVFAVPDELTEIFKYQAGQFITLFMHIKGQDVNRSYSFSSCPFIDKNLKITIQRVENGIGSNYLLDSVNIGDKMKVSPPAGSFFKPTMLAGENKGLLLFAAGSGITPVYSILRFKNYYAKECKARLVFSNKVSEQIIFKNSLDSLENGDPNLKVFHHISREESPPYRKLSSTDVKVHFNGLVSEGVDQKDIQVFLCGPDPYMNMIKETLLNEGVSSEQIHFESFNASSNIEDTSLGQGGSAEVFIETFPDDLSIESGCQLSAEIDGDSVNVDYQDADNILEALLNAGESPPFSCMAGACQACMCELVEGKVIQEDPGVLEEEDIKRKRFLSCQAQPLSSSLKVKFLD